MQALIDIIAGLVALIATAALSLFGVDMNPPQKPRAEIHRVHDCGDGASATLLTSSAKRTQDC